jgi:hypothetical protein
LGHGAGGQKTGGEIRQSEILNEGEIPGKDSFDPCFFEEGIEAREGSDIGVYFHIYSLYLVMSYEL